jgi:hypothetical protein
MMSRDTVEAVLRFLAGSKIPTLTSPAARRSCIRSFDYLVESACPGAPGDGSLQSDVIFEPARLLAGVLPAPSGGAGLLVALLHRRKGRPATGKGTLI